MSTIKGLSLNEDGKLDVKLNGELFARNENGEISLKLADGLSVGDNGLEIDSEIGGSVAIDPTGGLVEGNKGLKVAIGTGLGYVSGVDNPSVSEINVKYNTDAGLTATKEKGLQVDIGTGLEFSNGDIIVKLGSNGIDTGLKFENQGLLLATKDYSGLEISNNALGIKLSNYINDDNKPGYTYYGISNPLEIGGGGLHLRLATGVDSSGTGSHVPDSGLTEGPFGGLRLDFNTSQFSLVNNKLTLKGSTTDGSGGSVTINPNGGLVEGNNGLGIKLGSDGEGTDSGLMFKNGGLVAKLGTGLEFNNGDGSIELKLGSDGEGADSGLKFENQGLKVAIGSGLWIDDEHCVAVQLTSDSGLGLIDGLHILYNEDQFEIVDYKLTLKNGATGGSGGSTGGSGGSVTINPNGGLVEGNNGLGIKLGSDGEGTDSGLMFADGGLVINLSSGVDEFGSDVNNGSGLTISDDGLCIKLAKKSTQNPGCESSGLTLKNEAEDDGLSVKLSSDSGLHLAADGLQIRYNEDQFEINNDKLTLKDGVAGGTPIALENACEGGSGKIFNGSGLRLSADNRLSIALTTAHGKHSSGLHIDEDGMYVKLSSGLDLSSDGISIKLKNSHFGGGLDIQDGNLKIELGSTVIGDPANNKKEYGAGLILSNDALALHLDTNSGLQCKYEKSGLGIKLGGALANYKNVDASGLILSDKGLGVKLADSGLNVTESGISLNFVEAKSGLTLYKPGVSGLSVKLATSNDSNNYNISGLELTDEGLKLSYDEDQFSLVDNKLTLKDGVAGGGSVTIDPKGGLVEGDNGLGLNVGAGLKIDGNGAIALAETISTGEGTIVLGKHLKLDENGAVTVDIASLLGKYLKVDENGAATIDTAELLSDIASTN